MTVYDAEIDLRPYIVSIVQNWWKVAIVCLIAIASALWLGLRQPFEYEATASILLTRSRASLSLTQEFPTLSEPIDSASRMSAFLSIAKSDALAYQTMRLIEEEIPLEEHDLENFKNKVTISNTGDLILVKAIALDPRLAERIANAWAEQAVISINLAYSGDQLPSQLLSQLESAKADYEFSQAALESFLQTSQLNVLHNRILESQTLFDSLSNTRAWKIVYYTQRIQDLDQIISRGEALQQQLEGGEGSIAANIGDAIAVLTARATVFGLILSPVSLPQSSTKQTGENTTPIVINNSGNREGLSFGLNVDELSNFTDVDSSYQEDLDSLIQLARAEKSKAEQNLQELSLEVLNNETNDLVQQTAAEIQVLSAQLENELARQKGLTSERDLAWKAYQVMAEKNTELKNATQTNNQVSLATLAVPPEKPQSRGILIKVVIGAVLGTLIGILIVLLVEWWRQTVTVASRAESPSHAVDPN